MTVSGPDRVSSLKNRLARLVGPLLIFYMLLLLVTTWVAQQDFRASYAAQLQLDLEQRASALSYFYQERLNSLQALAEDSTFEAYFANEALGMSMEYGLRASLLKIARLLEEKARTPLLGGQPVLARLLFLNEHSRVLVDTRPDAPGLGPNFNPDLAPAGYISVLPDTGVVVLTLPCQYKDQRKGYLLAVVNHDLAFQHLVYEDGGLAASRIFILAGGHSITRGETLPEEIADQLRQWAPSEASAALDLRGSSILVHAPVKATPFCLVGQYYPTKLTGYLTSNWSIGLLGLLALFLLITLAIANRIRTQHLILQGRLEESAQHRQLLSEQNLKLEEEIRKRREYEAQLVVKANFDSLTLLPNRVLALDRLSQALLQSERQESFIGVALVDLDRFKKVNDTLGHGAGDRLLVEAAKRLTQAVREGDTVARLGGDEFLILLPGLNQWENAEFIAQRILESFARSFVIASHEFFVTTSIGLAIAPEDGRDAQTLLKNADIALYKAKDEGRNTCCFFTPTMNEDLKTRQAMENLLVHALDRNELFLVYQPVIRLADGSIAGAEALLRWRNPTLGQVPPDRFIPLSEDLGLIEEIGQWVLNQACLQASQWRRLLPFRLAVNVSSAQLRGLTVFPNAVNAALAASGFPVGNLELEVTESIVLDDSTTSRAVLQNLDALGVRLAIDDFGTGYSALSYLKKFPFDTLKIDRSFVRDLPHDEGGVALARAILAMAHALNLEVVAEGIENQDQAAFMTSQGCDLAQGYYFHKPMAPEELTRLLCLQASGPEQAT